MSVVEFPPTGEAALSSSDGRFLATSVARHMLARIEATHARRRIAVFAGPPGIGKTSAIDEFRTRHPGEVAITKVSRRNTQQMLVLQYMLAAVQELSGATWPTSLTSVWGMQRYIKRAIEQWTRMASERSSILLGSDQLQRLTVVFDEAQNLSRDAIEVLRYWNDSDRCYAPFPIGLVFIGNSEFSLEEGATGSSTISAAVADRAYHIQTLDYDDVTDDDISLFMSVNGIANASVRAMIVRQLRAQRSPRSFRRVADLVEELKEIAGEAPVTPETVRQLLRPI